MPDTGDEVLGNWFEPFMKEAEEEMQKPHEEQHQGDPDSSEDVEDTRTVDEVLSDKDSTAYWGDVEDHIHKFRRVFGMKPMSEIARRPPRKALVEGMFPQVGVSCVYGASGSAKTYLMAYLAHCVASGGSDFLGHAALEHGDVLYIASEDLMGVEDRMYTLYRKYGVPRHTVAMTNVVAPVDKESTLVGRKLRDLWAEMHPESELPPGDPSPAPQFLDSSNTEHVLNKLQINPKLIIIDTMSTAFAAIDSENDNTQVAQAVAAMERLSEALQCCVLFVHHTGKPGPDGKTPKSPRGASAIQGNVFSLLRAEKTPGKFDAEAGVSAPAVFRLFSEKWKSGVAYDGGIRFSLGVDSYTSESEDYVEVSYLLRRTATAYADTYAFLYEAAEAVGKEYATPYEIMRKVSSGKRSVWNSKRIKEWCDSTGFTKQGCKYRVVRP